MKTTVRKHTRRTKDGTTDVIKHERNLNNEDYNEAVNNEVLLPPEEQFRMARLREDHLYYKTKMTEQDVNLVLRRINTKKITPSEVFKLNSALESGDGVELTAEQNKKGLDFLKKRTFNAKGEIKDSSELREREANIISDSKAEIRLKDFYSERGDYYVPLYVVSGNDTTMEYYYLNGKINIIG